MAHYQVVIAGQTGLKQEYRKLKAVAAKRDDRMLKAVLVTIEQTPASGRELLGPLEGVGVLARGRLARYLVWDLRNHL